MALPSSAVGFLLISFDATRILAIIGVIEVWQVFYRWKRLEVKKSG